MMLANKQCIIHGVFVCVLLHAVTPYPKHKGTILYIIRLKTLQKLV